MQLHELQRLHPRKYPKTRVGRGGKRGTTSGRGTKGQRSRAGHRIRPAGRDFILRLPKFRGIGQRPSRPKPQIVNLDMLAKLSETTVTINALAAARMIRNKSAPIKILGRGNLKIPLTIKHIPVSLSARKKIESAGGTIIP